MSLFFCKKFALTLLILFRHDFYRIGEHSSLHVRGELVAKQENQAVPDEDLFFSGGEFCAKKFAHLVRIEMWV